MLEVLVHPDQKKYPGQKIFVIKAMEYVFLVPFEETDQEIRLKTIIPSRKAVRKYMKGGKADEKHIGG